MPITGVGRLVGELGLDIGKFEDGLRRAGSRLDNNLKGWEQRTRQIGDRLGAIGKTLSLRLTAPILGLGAAGIALVNRLGNAAAQMLALRDAFGLSLDFIQGLRGAAIAANVPWESLQNTFRRISELLREVETADDVPEVFNDLGIAIFDADGKMRSMQSIFLEIIEALSQVENPLRRAQLGTELFGDEWPRVAPLIAMGRDEVEKLIVETDKVPESTLEATADAATQWQELQLQLENLLMEGITPVITAFLKLPKPIQAAVVATLGFLAILGPVLIGLKLLAGVLLFVAANPVVLIIAGIVAIVAVLAIMMFKWDEVTSFIERRTGKWAPVVEAALLGLLGPIANIGLALQKLREDWETLQQAIRNPGGVARGFRDALRLGGIPGFANGVQNFSGGLAMVGERGPELVNLPRGSDVIPSGGGFGSGNVIIQGDVLDGDHFLRLIGRTGTRIINGGGWNKLQRR